MPLLAKLAPVQLAAANACAAKALEHLEQQMRILDRSWSCLTRGVDMNLREMSEVNSVAYVHLEVLFELGTITKQEYNALSIRLYETLQRAVLRRAAAMRRQRHEKKYAHQSSAASGYEPPEVS